MSRRRNCLAGTFWVLLSFLERKQNPLQVSLFEVNCLQLIYPCSSLHYIGYIWHTGPGIWSIIKKFQKCLSVCGSTFPDLSSVYKNQREVDLGNVRKHKQEESAKKFLPHFKPQFTTETRQWWRPYICTIKFLHCTQRMWSNLSMNELFTH